MKILLIGGTKLVGRHIAQAALDKGHELTLFNRGKSNPDLFPEVEHLTGDRNNPDDLAQFEGRQWDAVIDTSGYYPRQMDLATQQLADKVSFYVFISTISVYSDFSIPNMDESGPLGELKEGASEDQFTAENYGPFKVLCEQIVEKAFPDRNLIIRPGIIAGPYDHSERFTYWPHRAAQGGTMLAPGQPDERVLYIDARDLAEWTIRMTEAKQTGIYNTYGPDYPLTMGQFLDECKKVTGSQTELVWVDTDFLREISLLDEVPLWVPASDPELAGWPTIRSDKAIAAGLTYRPLAETIRDTLAWSDSREPGAVKWEKLGLNAENEAQALSQWAAKRSKI